MGEKETNKERSLSSRMLMPLVLIGVASIYIIVMLLIIPSFLNSDVFQSFFLPLVLVFGVIEIVVVLTLSAGILNRFGLSSKEEALGLPSGSVRALIALSLIVIFAIMAVYMQGKLVSYPLTDVNGTIIRDINGTAIMVEPSQGQRDFSLQTLTTVSTLMVAVAGFYFGTKTAETGKAEKERAPKKKKLEVIVTPKDFVKVKSGKELAINVKTKPETKAINWKIEGDTSKSLIHEKLGEFKYTPSNKPDRTKDVVILTFEVADKPEIKEKLIVEIQ